MSDGFRVLNSVSLNFSFGSGSDGHFEIWAVSSRPGAVGRISISDVSSIALRITTQSPRLSPTSTLTTRGNAMQLIRFKVTASACGSGLNDRSRTPWNVLLRRYAELAVRKD